MIYDIRNISLYVNKIHSRYYIDTNAVVYTSISGDTNRIMIDGIRYNIKSFIKTNKHLLNKNDNMIIKLPYGKNYFLLYDGTILKRLNTRKTKTKEIDVCLMTLGGNSSGNRWTVARLMGYVFLGLTVDKEIHHIDKNRLNNKLENLKVLSFEEHRGKGNFRKNH